MIGRVSYEPSVQALLHTVLPAGWWLAGGEGGLRHPAAWPVLVRATGVGSISGGEVLVVPPARVDVVVSQLESLAASGVAAVVLMCDRDQGWAASLPTIDLPIAVVRAAIDPRSLREVMEAHIIRRRRELYELAHNLQRTLVEGSIGGMSAQALLLASSRASGRLCLLDQDGEVLGPQGFGASLPDDLLASARLLSCRENAAGSSVHLPGPPEALATAVVTGRDRRGTVLLLEPGENTPDEDEIVLQTVASALAIALGRETPAPPQSLEALFSDPRSFARNRRATSERSRWTGCALMDRVAGPARVERAIAAELEGRDMIFLLAREGGRAVVLIEGCTELPWESIVRSIRTRAGAPNLRAGLGQTLSGVTGARRSAEQALEALRRAGEGTVTRYESVELHVLLGDVPGGDEYVARRLGPLLGGDRAQRDLLDTVQAYLASGCNAMEAAGRVGVHRNTLAYRLRRAGELLEMDLSDPAVVFSLDLALHILAARQSTLSESDDSG